MWILQKWPATTDFVWVAFKQCKQSFQTAVLCHLSCDVACWVKLSESFVSISGNYLFCMILCIYLGLCGRLSQVNSLKYSHYMEVWLKMHRVWVQHSLIFIYILFSKYFHPKWHVIETARWVRSLEKLGLRLILNSLNGNIMEHRIGTGDVLITALTLESNITPHSCRYNLKQKIHGDSFT